MAARAKTPLSVGMALATCWVVGCGNLMGYDDIEFADDPGASLDSGTRDAGADSPISPDAQADTMIDHLAAEGSGETSSTGCGDGVCIGEETCESCAVDCGDEDSGPAKGNRLEASVRVIEFHVIHKPWASWRAGPPCARTSRSETIRRNKASSITWCSRSWPAAS